MAILEIWFGVSFVFSFLDGILVTAEMPKLRSGVLPHSPAHEGCQWSLAHVLAP